MKTKLIKSIMASLVVACASLTMVAATASGQGTQGGTLRGTWEMQITLTDYVGLARSIRAKTAAFAN